MALLLSGIATARPSLSTDPQRMPATRADARASDGTPIKTLQTVTVVGHYANGVGTSNAASQGIILGQLLRDIPLLRPGEVLENIPGMVVTQH